MVRFKSNLALYLRWVQATSNPHIGKLIWRDVSICDRDSVRNGLFAVRRKRFYAKLAMTSSRSIIVLLKAPLQRFVTKLNVVKSTLTVNFTDRYLTFLPLHGTTNYLFSNATLALQSLTFLRTPVWVMVFKGSRKLIVFLFAYIKSLQTSTNYFDLANQTLLNAIWSASWQFRHFRPINYSTTVIKTLVLFNRISGHEILYRSLQTRGSYPTKARGESIAVSLKSSNKASLKAPISNIVSSVLHTYYLQVLHYGCTLYRLFILLILRQLN